MKITILSPDLSHNCLGRAYLLAKILQRRHKVEVVGPLFGEEIWQPVIEDSSIPYRWTKLNQAFHPSWHLNDLLASFTPYSQLNELARTIDADALYASKPLVTSFGLGLLKKLGKHCTISLRYRRLADGVCEGLQHKRFCRGSDLVKPGKTPQPKKALRHLLAFLATYLRIQLSFKRSIR